MDFFVTFLSTFFEINRLNNFCLDNKGMDETFIPVLMVNGTKKHGKNLIS